MLALLLYLWLGPRAALAELMAELLIGSALLGGGRGKLVGATGCCWRACEPAASSPPDAG
jgi:hypothetical protein